MSELLKILVSHRRQLRKAMKKNMENFCDALFEKAKEKKTKFFIFHTGDMEKEMTEKYGNVVGVDRAFPQ